MQDTQQQNNDELLNEVKNHVKEQERLPVAAGKVLIKKKERFFDAVKMMANLGLKHPQWRRDLKSKAQGGDNHWTKKKKFSEQAKINMSEAQKRLYKKGYKHPNRKPVYKLDIDGVLIKKVGFYIRRRKGF